MLWRWILTVLSATSSLRAISLFARPAASSARISRSRGVSLSASLVRTGVGRFRQEQTVELEAMTAADVIPLHLALPPMPLLPLSDDQVRQIREGRAVVVDDLPPGAVFGLLKPDGTVFSVARRLGPVLQPECVIPAEAVLDAV